MTTTSPEQSKALMLEAFETLFNKRDYAAAEAFRSDSYIQHSAHIPPGRDGLFNLTHALPDTLRYENHLILAEGDYVIAHGRFSGRGRPRSWIAADIVRFENGKLAQHWDVLQDEALAQRYDVLRGSRRALGPDGIITAPGDALDVFEFEPAAKKAVLSQSAPLAARRRIGATSRAAWKGA